MKDLVGRRTVIAASVVAPKARARNLAVLQTVGARVRSLEHRLARANGQIEVNGLIETEIAHEFEKLLDLIGDHQCLGDELRRQLGVICDLLGIERGGS